MPTYRIMTRTTRMPASCRGNYKKAALVELEPGFEGEPAMISTRARGVARIVELRDCLYAGKTRRCALEQALEELRARKAELEAKEAP